MKLAWVEDTTIERRGNCAEARCYDLYIDDKRYSGAFLLQVSSGWVVYNKGSQAENIASLEAAKTVAHLLWDLNDL